MTNRLSVKDLILVIVATVSLAATCVTSQSTATLTRTKPLVSAAGEGNPQAQARTLRQAADYKPFNESTNPNHHLHHFSPNNQLSVNSANNNNITASSPFVRRLQNLHTQLHQGQKHDHVHYQTTFACEGNKMDLKCQDGKMIHLVRANYGRFSLSICNELNHVNLNVHCTEFRAFLIMQTRCDKLSNCSVDVSKELFGDPCEGTSKYLEVQYYCDDVNNNNHQQPQSLAAGLSRAANQAQIAPSPPLQQLAGAGADQPATPGADRTNSNKSPPVVAINGQQQQQQQQQVGSQQQPTQEFPATRDQDQQQLPSVVEDAPGQQQQQQLGSSSSSVIQQFCMAQTSGRNLFWNHTLAGQVARRSCPDGSSGKASWRCDPVTLRFSPAWSPDFTRCKSNWLQRLAQQLDQMLEAPGKQPGATEWMRQHNEQILKVIVSDLALMAKTKELFSEDLKRIDIMLGQIMAQMRSLSILFTRGNVELQNFNGASSQMVSLFEELFSKMVAIVSSLFDVQQRSAWLEVQPDDIQRFLEMKFLEHLKDSGAMLAHVSRPFALEQSPLRQANVVAGITVIPGAQSVTGRLRELMYNSNPQQQQQQETSLFNLQLQKSSSQQQLDRFVPFEGSVADSQQVNEFRIQLSALQPLIANGITRFLVLDVKKPDYSLIRQQLEAAFGPQMDAQSSSSSTNSNNLVATGDQQWISRVFGVFAIAGESGDVLDGHTDSQREQKLAEVLADAPISVDFKVSSGAGANAGAGGLQLAARQCNSLSDNVNLPNRCQTYKFNATNHICRCTQFGFVALTTALNQVPNTIGQSVNMGPPWPQLPGAPQNTIDFMDDEMRVMNIGQGRAGINEAPPTFIGAQKQQPSQQQSVGFWTTIFIVFGLSLLVVSLAAFVIQTIVRINSQSRLNKKQGFLSAGCSSILGNSHNPRDLAGGPTTGPLTDHNLMAQDPLTASSVTSTTNHSTSIIGLTQSACHGYKTHQQLYAAHYPTIEPGYNVAANKWRSLTNWLRPLRWLTAGGRNSAGKPVDHLGVIQHRIIGSTLSGPMGAYKSQFQNGYTTTLHHQGASTIGASSQLPLAAPSSSTSSYVSSSAYYEEIGPGNLTKVNPSQLANGQRHTLVEPFKRPPADQQQLLNDANHHSHHQQQQQQQHLQQAGGWTATIGQQHHQVTGPASYSNRSMQMPSVMAQNSAKHPHNDLSQLQSSGSSGNSSQHSASTNMTSVNGGQTPRHFLFASPQAVNAYESSMNQLNMQSQQQQQQHHLSQPAVQPQQYFSHQHRFMPSG